MCVKPVQMVKWIKQSHVYIFELKDMRKRFVCEERNPRMKWTAGTHLKAYIIYYILYSCGLEQLPEQNQSSV